MVTFVKRNTETAMRPPRVTDEELEADVGTIGNGNGDNGDTNGDEDIDTSELASHYSIDGDALAESARNLGSKAGKASEDAITIVSKAKEDWQGGPFRVLFGLQADFSPEELDRFAVPDVETGNNPDKFKVHKMNAKGKQTLVQSNFYVNFADGTPSGQDILAKIEFTQRASDPKAVKDDIPQEIMDMNPHERETYLNFLQGRRNTIRLSYRKAMALYFKQKEIQEYPGISCEPIWERGKGPNDVAEGEAPTVANTPKPISIWVTPEEGRPPTKWQTLSIGEFMRLDPKRAQEKGGTFQALLDSGVKPKAAGGGATTNNGDGFVIKTVDRGVEVMAEFHRWLEEITTAKDKVEYGKLVKLGNSKDNDEFIVSLVEARNILADLANDVKADAKYVKLQQSGSDLVQATKAKAA